MNTFNKNPFKKDTPVTPFSNATQYMVWHENNCADCAFYESESESEDKAKCKLAYHIDIGTVIGTIPLWVAKEIGCSYDALYQFCDLGHCRKRIYPETTDDFPF